MKKVIIVGSSSEIAISFYQNYKTSHSIVRIGRSQFSADYIVEEYSEEELKNIFNKICETGEIDAVIVFNGIGKAGRIGNIPLNKIEEMVQINLMVPYAVMHCIKNIFENQKKGHLITIGSVAGIKYSPNYAMYSATKFALRALSEAFRNEMQMNNVKTTLIQPGFVETKFWNTFGVDDSKFNYDENIAVSPGDVSQMIDFCLSTKGKFIINDVVCRSVYQER